MSTPRTARRTRRLPAALRGLGALAALLVLLVGVPIGLWIVGHNYLPTSVPSLQQIQDALTTQDSGQLLLGVAVVVGFLAWAVFAVSTVIELAARVRRRPALQIRGLGWAQTIAGILLTAIITGLLGGTGANAATAQALPLDAHQGPPATTSAPAFPTATAPTSAPTAAAATTSASSSTTTTPISTTSPQQTSAQAPPAAGQPAAPAASPAAPPQRTYTVRPRDTLWGLAQRWYGDGVAFSKIKDLNVGRAQADGRAMDASGEIFPGWKLVVPADAAVPASELDTTPGPAHDVQVTVRPGDTLSEIALEETGDAGNYPEIFARNAGRPQADGRALTNPDLIYPNWTLTVPVPGAAPAPPAATSGQPPAAQPSAPPATPQQQSTPQQTTSAPTSAAPPATTAPPASAAVPPGATAPAQPTTPAQQQPTNTAPAPTSAQQPAAPPKTTITPVATPAAPTTTPVAEPAADGLLGDLLHAPFALTVSAILAGALSAGLVVARRRQHRHRGDGRQVALPSNAAIRVERAMRAASARVDISFLDLALRSLSAQLADQDHDNLPDVLAAWLGPAGLRLQLARPRLDAPAPFRAEPDGLHWFVPADADLPVTADTAADHLAPLPTLASVGRLDDEQFLLDLEGLGALRITGNPTKAVELLRHLAAELAHNIWSDGLDVLLVGEWGAALTAINPARIRAVPTLSEALTGLRQRLDDAHRTLESSDAESVLHGRVNDLDGDAWMPEVLLVACPEDTDAKASTEAELVDVLRQLAEVGRSVVAVVATGVADPTAPGLTIQIDATGTLTVPDLVADPLRAEGIPEAIVGQFVELFAAAQADDEPIPEASDPAPWAQMMDASGRLMTSQETPPVPADRTAGDDTEAAETMAQQNVARPTQPVEPPAAQQLTAAGPGHQDGDRDGHGDPPFHGRLVEFSPRDGGSQQQAQAQLDLVREQDPTLDADLREWHAVDCVRPKVGILGEPTVAGPGLPPQQRMQFYTEVLTYLALHPRGVKPDKLVDDLWEGQQVQRVTYRQVMSTARKWAGTFAGDDGKQEFYLTHARSDEPYRLVDCLLDWALFRRLRKRAQAATAAGDVDAAVTDYRAALDLVRGPAFANLRPGGYSWLANRDQSHDRHLPGFVAETATELVDLALAAGDFELAEWAATTALAADPYRTEDRPLLDLMRIAHARGDQAALERHARQLLTDADAEVPEDLPPHTFATFNQLLPRGLRSLRRGA
jgi:nucleoid-associated protein YgaU